MLKRYNPETAPASYSIYSQGVEVPAAARLFYVSGQVGVLPDGSLAGDAEAQIDQAWKNVLAILEAAGFGAEDLVKVNTFMTRPEDVELQRKIRDRVVKDGGPAATMVTVVRLSHPDWIVEIEAVAAKA